MLSDMGTYTSSLRRSFYVGSMFTWTVLTSEKLYVGYALLSVCVCVNVGSYICSLYSSVSSRKTMLKHLGEMTTYAIAIISILIVLITAGNYDCMFVQRM
jgi:hypothetical protein